MPPLYVEDIMPFCSTQTVAFSIVPFNITVLTLLLKIKLLFDSEKETVKVTSPELEEEEVTLSTVTGDMPV